MKRIETPIPGLEIVQFTPHRDSRGSFTRLFCARELHLQLGGRQIVQINHSITDQQGTVRGMHFQYPPYAEMKMVACVRGRVWDVAVDIRADSPTFLEWYGLELTPEDAKMLLIPEGFAHGFQALDPDSELIYLHTEFHDPSAEGGLRHDDPRLAITWPLDPQDLSPRDQSHPRIADDFRGIAL